MANTPNFTEGNSDIMSHIPFFGVQIFPTYLACIDFAVIIIVKETMVFSTVIISKYTNKIFRLEIGSKLKNILCKKYFHMLIIYFNRWKYNYFGQNRVYWTPG